MKKNLLVLSLAAMITISLAACGSSDRPAQASVSVEENTTAAEEITGVVSAEASTTEEVSSEAVKEPEFITVKTLNADREETEVEVPYNPERVATLELASLDILDNLGLGDRVVGLPKSITVDYLMSYVEDDKLLNLGTLKEPDLEAIMESEPEIIFISGRMASFYDQLSEIAPVVFTTTDVELGVIESTGVNAKNVASIFGKEAEIDALLDEYDVRVTALQETAAGKTAIVGMVTSGGFNVLGNDGRCSIIGNEIGFENVGIDANVDTSTHGNEASYEFILSVDPDYIFVMDRDAAIAAEGAKLAEEVMNNELVKMTAASQNNKIVYLANSNVWYTAEGGITALGIMLSDLESELLK